MPANGDTDRSSLLRSASASPASDYGSLGRSEHQHHASGATPDNNNIEDDVLPETSVIGRTISWRSAYILTVSRVLGSGIFATPGIILAAVGSPGLAFCLWIAGAFVAYFGLAVTLEYGCMLPRSGGEKVYLEFTFRRPKYLMSVLIATQSIFLGFTASNCVIFAQYLLFGLGYEDTESAHKVIAIALMTAITIIHACFVRVGIAIQDFLGWIKIVLILFMIVSGPLVILTRQSGAESHAAVSAFASGGVDWTWAGLWAGSIWSWGSIATSFLKVYYSYVGLGNLNYVLNEVKDPVRTLKSVSMAALFTIGAMYLMTNIAFLLVVPIDEVKSSGELIAALFFERVFGESVGRRFLPIVVALSAAGNVMVVTFALARLNQEIARTGLIPGSRILSSTAPFGSPLGGLILHYIPSVLVIAIPPGDVYSFILEVEGYPAQIFSALIAFGLLWLRFKRPDLKRPYKAWIPGVLVRIVLGVALLLGPFFPSPDQRAGGWFQGAAYALVGICILAFGLIYWLVWTVALPKWYGYVLEDHTEMLDDGTSVTRLVRVPK